MKYFNHWLLCLLSLVASQSLTAKPFKRVLVINGGGINPGIAVGIIDGVKSMGWNPDLIIATCGANIGSSINNSEGKTNSNLEKLKSQEFFKVMNLVKIQTSSVFEMVNKIEEAKNTTKYPSIFSKVLLNAPDQLPKIFNTTEFSSDDSRPRMIFLSGRALFGPNDAGKPRRKEPLFQQVYFTDRQTAQYFDGWMLAPEYAYPNSTIEGKTVTITNVDTLTATRAGLADPYLLNPSFLADAYHFTGAIDLYPIDLANYLGDEVITTYPAALFLEHEDRVINAAFGFKQTRRALDAIQNKNVKWIDISGMDELGFNPKAEFLTMVSTIPTNYNQFVTGVSKQWTFGFERAKEALSVAPGNTLDVRTHLRKPINPKLREEFSCKNANEWKTGSRSSCTSDSTPDCNRNSASSCTPIR